MYRKVITTSNKIKLDHHHPKWLSARRVSVAIFPENIQIGKEKIPIELISEKEFYNYKSFLFFKIYSIFGFKYNDKHYQIGINNNEKRFLKSVLKNYKTEEASVKVVDFVYILVIFVALGWFISLVIS